MKCKIDGCDRDAMYQKDQVCQKHYFRMMRYGTYDLTRKKRKYRVQTPNGYQKVYEPSHFLADNFGYVFEHRFVYFKFAKKPTNCAICGKKLDFDTCMVDHIDEDKTNNKLENLRELCRGCNCIRGYCPTTNATSEITINGVTGTPEWWSRQDGVKLSGSSIRRRKIQGWSDYDCVFKERITHKNTNTKQKQKNHEWQYMSHEIKKMQDYGKET